MAPMATSERFFNLYRHGFARVALATPLVRIGEPMANAAATLALMREATRGKAVVAVFPELGLSAYSCEDLFHQQALLRASEEALAWLLARSQGLPLAAFVGLPVVVDGLLYNCAALLCRGRLLLQNSQDAVVDLRPRVLLESSHHQHLLIGFIQQAQPRGDALRRRPAGTWPEFPVLATDLLRRHGALTRLLRLRLHRLDPRLEVRRLENVETLVLGFDQPLDLLRRRRIGRQTRVHFVTGLSARTRCEHRA